MHQPVVIVRGAMVESDADGHGAPDRTGACLAKSVHAALARRAKGICRSLPAERAVVCLGGRRPGPTVPASCRSSGASCRASCRPSCRRSAAPCPSGAARFRSRAASWPPGASTAPRAEACLALEVPRRVRAGRQDVREPTARRVPRASLVPTVPQVRRALPAQRERSLRPIERVAHPPRRHGLPRRARSAARPRSRSAEETSS